MARDWQQELNAVRLEIRQAADEITRADAEKRGGDLVRAWIRAQAFGRGEQSHHAVVVPSKPLED